MTEVHDYSDKLIDYDAAVNLMDDELREELHMTIAPCTPQEFIDAYADAHAKKYGEEFAPYYGLAW